MSGQMYYKDLHFFWQDLLLLGVCFVPKKCDADDEFGTTESWKTGFWNNLFHCIFFERRVVAV